MYRTTLIVLTVLLLAGAASGQIWIDGFSYAKGTTIGTWTEWNGNWVASGSMVACQQLSKWQYLTQQKLSFKDVSIQCDSISTAKSLQFMGPALRVNKPSSGGLGSDLVMLKVQDNNSDGQYDYYYLYEISATGSSSIKKSGSLTASANMIVRLSAIDQRVVGEIDTNADGLFDVVIDTTVTLTAKTGPIGLAGYNRGAADNFKLFDAVLLHDTGTAKPQPGNEVKLVMRGAPSLAYLAASALGNTGFPISTSARFPLSPDTLFGVTVQNLLPGVFKTFRGVLDSKGDGKMSIDIPNISALKGVTIYTAYVVYGSTQIVNISNDYQFTIQ